MSDSKGGGSGRAGRSAPTGGAAPAPAPAPAPTAAYKEFGQEKYGSAEAVAYGEKIAAAWDAGLSPGEQDAVLAYKADSVALNKKLRGDKKLGKDAGSVQNLDNALSRASIPDDITVYRGVDRKVVDSLFRGNETVLDKGFMSTTGSEFVAKDFAGGGYIINIKVPKGSRGMYIDSDPKGSRPLDGEHEFLFARNSRLRILGINESSRTVDAILEQ